MGSSCVPEDEFLKEDEAELATNLDNEDLLDTLGEPAPSGFEHALSFEEMVQQLILKLNNNQLDSGRTAYFTAQAPFSPTDKLIIYTESNCSGKYTEVPFSKFVPIMLNQEKESEEGGLIYQLDSELDFYENIVKPAPKVNLNVANHLPPYEIKLKGVREGVFNYSFKFERESRRSFCLNFSNMNHIVEREKPMAPVEIVMNLDNGSSVSSNDESPTTAEIDMNTGVSFEIVGDYIGENIVGLFAVSPDSNDPCGLQNLIHTEDLGFTPGINIGLNLSEYNSFQSLRGEVEIYTAFINPYGMVSDCHGPVYSTVITPPATPVISLSSSVDSTFPGDFINRPTDGVPVFRFSVNVDVTAEYFQEGETIYWFPGNESVSMCPHIFLADHSLAFADSTSSTPEGQNTWTYSDHHFGETLKPLPVPITVSPPAISNVHVAADGLYTYGAMISSSNYDSTDCVEVSGYFDNSYPVVDTFEITSPSDSIAPEDCLHALEGGVNYTNCTELSYSLTISDPGTMMGYAELTTSPDCSGASSNQALILSENDNHIFSGTIEFNSTDQYFLYVKDGVGNEACYATGIGEENYHDHVSLNSPNYKWADPLGDKQVLISASLNPNNYILIEEGNLGYDGDYSLVFKGGGNPTFNGTVSSPSQNIETFVENSNRKNFKLFLNETCTASSYKDSFIHGSNSLSTTEIADPHLQANIINSASIVLYDFYGGVSNCSNAKYYHDTIAPAFSITNFPVDSSNIDGFNLGSRVNCVLNDINNDGEFYSNCNSLDYSITVNPDLPYSNLNSVTASLCSDNECTNVLSTTTIAASVSAPQAVIFQNIDYQSYETLYLKVTDEIGNNLVHEISNIPVYKEALPSGATTISLASGHISLDLEGGYSLVAKGSSAPAYDASHAGVTANSLNSHNSNYFYKFYKNNDCTGTPLKNSSLLLTDSSGQENGDFLLGAAGEDGTLLEGVDSTPNAVNEASVKFFDYLGNSSSCVSAKYYFDKQTPDIAFVSYLPVSGGCIILNGQTDCTNLDINLNIDDTSTFSSISVMDKLKLCQTNDCSHVNDPLLTLEDDISTFSSSTTFSNALRTDDQLYVIGEDDIGNSIFLALDLMPDSTSVGSLSLTISDLTIDENNNQSPFETSVGKEIGQYTHYSNTFTLEAPLDNSTNDTLEFFYGACEDAGRESIQVAGTQTTKNVVIGSDGIPSGDGEKIFSVDLVSPFFETQCENLTYLYDSSTPVPSVSISKTNPSENCILNNNGGSFETNCSNLTLTVNSTETQKHCFYIHNPDENPRTECLERSELSLNPTFTHSFTLADVPAQVNVYDFAGNSNSVLVPSVSSFVPNISFANTTLAADYNEVNFSNYDVEIKVSHNFTGQDSITYDFYVTSLSSDAASCSGVEIISSSTFNSNSSTQPVEVIQLAQEVGGLPEEYQKSGEFYIFARPVGVEDVCTNALHLVYDGRPLVTKGVTAQVDESSSTSECREVITCQDIENQSGCLNVQGCSWSGAPEDGKCSSLTDVVFCGGQKDNVPWIAAVDTKNDTKLWEVTLTNINGACEGLDFDKQGNIHCGGNTDAKLDAGGDNYFMQTPNNFDPLKICTTKYFQGSLNASINVNSQSKFYAWSFWKSILKDAFSTLSPFPVCVNANLNDAIIVDPEDFPDIDLEEGGDPGGGGSTTVNIPQPGQPSWVYWSIIDCEEFTYEPNQDTQNIFFWKVQAGDVDSVSRQSTANNVSNWQVMGTPGYDSCFSLTASNSSSVCGGAWGIPSFDESKYLDPAIVGHFMGNQSVSTSVNGQGEVVGAPNPMTFNSAGGYISFAAFIDKDNTDQTLKIRMPEIAEFNVDFSLDTAYGWMFDSLPNSPPPNQFSTFCGNVGCNYHYDLNEDSLLFYDSNEGHGATTVNTFSELYSIKKPTYFGGKTKLKKEAALTTVSPRRFFLGNFPEEEGGVVVSQVSDVQAGGISQCNDIEKVGGSDLYDLYCFGKSNHKPLIARVEFDNGSTNIIFENDYFSELSIEYFLVQGPPPEFVSITSGMGECHDGAVIDHVGLRRSTTQAQTNIVGTLGEATAHCLGGSSFDINNVGSTDTYSLILGVNSSDGSVLYNKELNGYTRFVNEYIESYEPVQNTVFGSSCLAGAFIEDGPSSKKLVCGGYHSNPRESMIYLYDMLPKM